jgi:hypothetical protein
VVTDGTWEWDAAAGTVVGTAVLAGLAGVFLEEPRHLDLRWARTETDLDVHNARFRDAVAESAAPIHGIAKDDLEGEDVRQHRRARRLARGGATALTLLVVISLALGTIAFLQRNDATKQRDKAERQARIATAQGLAAQATLIGPTKPDLALVLAAEAVRLNASTATRASLSAELDRAPHATRFNSDARLHALAPRDAGARRRDGGAADLRRVAPESRDQTVITARPTATVGAGQTRSAYGSA